MCVLQLSAPLPQVIAVCMNIKSLSEQAVALYSISTHVTLSNRHDLLKFEAYKSRPGQK